MKKYVSPVVLENADLAEGVFAASGGDESTCYTCTARIVQTPESGRENYVIQVDAHHDADHNSNKQCLTIAFNQIVNYVSCNAQGATYVEGNGTNVLTIDLTYWNNHTDNIGFGDLIVESADGLAILDAGVTMTDIGKQF